MHEQIVPSTSSKAGFVSVGILFDSWNLSHRCQPQRLGTPRPQHHRCTLLVLSTIDMSIDDDDDDLSPRGRVGTQQSGSPPLYRSIHEGSSYRIVYKWSGGEVRGSSPLGSGFWVVCRGCMIRYSSIVFSASLRYIGPSFFLVPLSHRGYVFCSTALLLHGLRSSNEYS